MVAGNGRGYLVVLATQGATDFTLDLSARLLRADGTLGSPFAVLSEADFAAGGAPVRQRRVPRADAAAGPHGRGFPDGRRQLLLACFEFSDHFRVVQVSTRPIQTP